MMDSNIEVEHEEQLDFHLEVDEDVSSEDDNMPSNQNPPLEEDGNGTSEKEKFRSMSHAAERHTTLDEHLEIMRMKFATEKDAYIFYNKYARDKGFSVKKQKVRRAKYSQELLFRRFLCSRQGEREPKRLNKKCTEQVYHQQI